MKSRAYRAIDVNQIAPNGWLDRGRGDVHVGLDVGKQFILCVTRWGRDEFERPWRVRNPQDLSRLAALLAELRQGRNMIVALEPTGTYGDALRQTLERAGIPLQRVNPKQASDYAEVFDGVPSQHDGKDAAVIAELAAQGKSWPWPLPRPTNVEQEMAYHVEWMDGQRRQMMQWCGRLEALLSRHWPEATRIMGLCSGTLLGVLTRYGGPGGLAAAPDGLERLRYWGGSYLSPEKAQALLDSACQTSGVKMGPWEEESVRRSAQQVQQCRQAIRASHRRLKQLSQEHATITAMGKVVGVATACVLWVELGAPSVYHCGPAYRKAMGLNLAERSSGQWQGKLRISKRGSSRVRRWLYLAALRWVRQEPVRSWYLRQKAARRGEGKAALVGVMRKLALALYCVGGRGEKFDREQLYRRVTASRPAQGTEA